MLHSAASQLSLFSSALLPAQERSVPGESAEPSAEPDRAFSIRISHRARRLSLQVMVDGRAELVVPKGTSQRTINRFVREHRDWLSQARAEQHARHGDVDLSMPGRIALAGVDEHWCIQRRISPAKPLRVSLRPGSGPSEFVLRLDGDAGINEDDLRVAVRARLMRRARDMFEQMLPSLATDMQSDFRRLQVRNQKTCWGSFSSRGTLSMNYAALFLPPALVRYLCVHELAHFHHMDHSPAFWTMVSRWVPEAREVDRQLGAKHAVVPAWLW